MILTKYQNKKEITELLENYGEAFEVDENDNFLIAHLDNVGEPTGGFFKLEHGNYLTIGLSGTHATFNNLEDVFRGCPWFE